MKMLSDECIEPEEGFYVRKADKVAEPCSANIAECDSCSRLGEAERPTCSECKNQLSFFSDTWDCRCETGKYFNPAWECKNNYPNCPRVENITEKCKEADHGYFIVKELKGTKKCSDLVEHCQACSRIDPSEDPVCSTCKG